MHGNILEILPGVSFINYAVTLVIIESFAPAAGASVNPLQIWIPVISGIWIAGIVGFLGYTVVSCRLLCRKVGTNKFSALVQ